MKKKHLQLLTLALLAITITWMLMNNNINSNIKLPEFSIKDTSKITAIKICKDTVCIEISKNNNLWLVNQKYEASEAFIKLALNTLAQISIKSPVAKPDRDKIIQLTKDNATKLEIFEQRKLVRTLFIGLPTPDSLGTYAMIDDKETPYITEIPGFTGYLSKRFPCNENVWRTRSVFRISINKIKQLTVDNYKEPAESFRIEMANKSFMLKNSEGKSFNNADTEKVKQYLSEFQRKDFIKYAELNSNKVDSIIKTDPFYAINIILSSGSKQNIKFYRKASSKRKDFFGNSVTFDPNQCFALLDNKDLVIVNLAEFAPVFGKISPFLIK